MSVPKLETELLNQTILLLTPSRRPLPIKNSPCGSKFTPTILIQDFRHSLEFSPNLVVFQERKNLFAQSPSAVFKLMRDWTPNSIEKRPLETPPSIKFEKYVRNSNDSHYKPAHA